MTEDSGTVHPKKPPGLEEALHPDIGNGVAWEQDGHFLALRSIDPTKAIEQYLLDAEHVRTTADETIIPVVSVTAVEVDEIPPSRPVKSKKKTPPSKSPPAKKVVAKLSAPKKKERTKPKAGKLVKKVAKSIKKLEKESKASKAEEIKAPVESSLSPFTQWLKNLRGSEYVHPYDDDFAFEQVNGLAGEGISETFADLLAAQGYHEQAIEMYRKLIQKFPEKSRFFAAKIEALK